ncbi:MAG: fibronectin type III domain-containing protein [Blastocatellia bacterium]
MQAINPGGQASNQFNFTVAPPSVTPTISSINPDQVVVNQATTLTINGRNFQSGFRAEIIVPLDTFPLASASLTFVDSTQIRVQVAMSGTPPYSATLRVTNPDNLSASGTFQVVTAPTITLNRPNSSCTAVSLSWSRAEINNFAAYKVYRAETTGVTVNSTLLVNISNRDTTQYTDSSLPVGRIFYYRVFVQTSGSNLIGSNEYGAQRSGGAAPVINSTAPTAATVGRQFTYGVRASDPESDPLSFQLTASPQGMGIDVVTGLLTWTPTATQTGNQQVVVVVSDGCNQTRQNFTVSVENPSPTGANALTIGAVTIRADRLIQVNASTTHAVGHVVINDFLSFDGDLTVQRDGVNHQVSGSGALFIDNIPRLNRKVIFRGTISFTLNGGAVLTNFARSVGEALNLAGVTVSIENLYLLSDGVRIEGELKLPPVYGASVRVTTLRLTRSGGLDLAGSVTFPTILLGPDVRLRDATLTFNTLDESFSGRASLQIPLYLFQVEVGVKMRCVNRVHAEIETNGVGIPIFTGLAIKGGNLDLDNLCSGPFSITLGVDISTADPILSHIVRLDNLQLTYTVPKKFVGAGALKIYDTPVASGKVTIDPPSVNVEVNATLSEFLKGDFELGIDPGGQNRAGRVTGTFKGEVQIPKTSKPGKIRQWVSAKLGLPYTLQQVEAGFDNYLISFQASLGKLTATVKLDFSRGFPPDVDLGGNFTSQLNLLAAAETNSPANRVALGQFARGLAAYGLAGQFDGQGLVLQAGRQLNVTLPGSLPQVLFSLQGQGRVPDFTLTTPDGIKITPASVIPNVDWAADSETFTSLYLIINPAPGRWTAETTDAVAVFDVVAPNDVPRITIGAVQNSLASERDNATDARETASAGQVVIQWSASSSNPNAQVSLFYDKDNAGADGVKVIDGLKVSDPNKSFNWNLANVPSGEYFVYAVINDGKNASVTAYSASKLTVDDPTAPAQPQGVAAQAIENAATVSWQPNPQAGVAGYTVHYTSDLSRIEYQKSTAAGLATSFRLTGLEPNKQYRMAVTAYNEAGRVSRFSLPQIINTSVGRSPVVQLTTPNGGERLITGQPFTIQWTASDDSRIETQQILLSSNGGLSYPIIIADNLPGTARSFIWNLPADLLSSALRLRVIATDAAGNVGADESDGLFAGRALPPHMALLTPNRVTVGSANLSLLIQGNNFAPVAVALANGQRLTTIFSNNTLLTATVPALLLATPGMLNIVIENPDGQRSDAQSLVVEPRRTVTTVSAASFNGDALAPESIVAAFGTDLARTTGTAPAFPLPCTLAGASIKVRDGNGIEHCAPLFFASPGQINFQIPPGTAIGSATITTDNGAGNISTGTVQIARVAPGLFAANANGQGVAAAVVLRIRANNAQSYEPVARFDQSLGRFVSISIDLGLSTDQVFLILYGTGIRYRSSLAAVTARIGGVTAQVSFAGAQGNLVGLDQVNVLLPRSLIGRGEVDITLTVDGKVANTVNARIK